jgi:hypothetical protein
MAIVLQYRIQRPISTFRLQMYLFYDPATDTFQELRGTGMALGVKADARFEENRRSWMIRI